MTLRIIAAAVLVVAGCNESTTGKYDTPEASKNAPKSEVADSAVTIESPSIDAHEPDIRNVSWGMSKEEVKALEDLKMEGERDGLGLAYKARLGDLEAMLFYLFVDDKLYRAGYLFLEKHTNQNLYINDFTTINNALHGKYGDWIGDGDWIWLNDRYMDDEEDMGLAISMGHLVRQVRWETPRHVIIHEITGDNYDITHRLIYESFEYGAVADEAKKKSIQDDI